MSYSISSPASLERAQSTVSLQRTQCSVVSSLRKLRPSLRLNFSDFQILLSSSGCLSELFFTLALLHACSPDMSGLSTALLPRLFSLSQLTLPTFLTDLKIISSPPPPPMAFQWELILRGYQRWPQSCSSRHRFQTRSLLFCKRSLAFFTPRGIPFNLAGLKASCWTTTS